MNLQRGSCQVIRSQKSSFSWVAELLWSLSLLRINFRYKETLFGYGWFFLQPVALTVIFTYLFNRFALITTGDVPYTLFAAIGLVSWSLTALVVNHSTYCITGLHDMVKRAAFPKILLPLSAVIATGVDLVAMAGLLDILFVYYQVSLSWAVSWIFILGVIHLTLLIGLSCLASLANVFFLRDIGQAIPLLLQLWFFSSPVFYSSSLLPEGFRSLIRWNPMTGLIEGYRSVLLLGHPPPLDFIIPAGLVSLGVFVVGLICFWRVKEIISDFL